MPQHGKTNSSDDDIFPINEQLLKHYNVIYKGHVESKMTCS